MLHISCLTVAVLGPACASGCAAVVSTSKVVLLELFGAFRRSQVFLTTADVISPQLSEQDTFLRYHMGWDNIKLACEYLRSHQPRSCIPPSSYNRTVGENKNKSFKARMNISYRLSAHSCCINTNNISAEQQYSAYTVSCLRAVLLNTAPRGQEDFCHVDWTGFHFTAHQWVTWLHRATKVG